MVLRVKNLPANAGDIGGGGLIPGWGRSPGGGNGNLEREKKLGSSLKINRQVVENVAPVTQKEKVIALWQERKM